MVKISFSKFITAGLLLLFLAGCINLKNVNGYSTHSLAILKNFEQVDYTFSRSCENRCAIDQLEKQELFRKDCDCKANNDADSVTLILYNAINGYFDGLAKLSADELTTYKFNTANLVEGKYGDITINKEHIASYTKISTILLKAFTDGYRKKKIATYVGDANEPIQTLINAFGFTLEANLSKKLEVEKLRYQSYYFDLLKDATTSAYEKKKIIDDYNIMQEKNIEKKNQLAIFGKGLRKIAAGHQSLYEGRNKLSANELTVLLTASSNELKDISTAFNKLKKNN